jgi:hypothetical protein
MKEETGDEGYLNPAYVRALNRPIDSLSLPSQSALERAVFDLATQEGLSDENLDVLLTIFYALVGRHPRYRLKLEIAPEGRPFARAKAVENAHSATLMANEIDCEIARGMKQESAVEAASAKFGISRREVFRRLAAVRKWRADHLEFTKPGDAEILAGVPKGFKIRDDGHLVPAE